MNPSTKSLTQVVFTNFLRSHSLQFKIVQKRGKIQKIKTKLDKNLFFDSRYLLGIILSAAIKNVI